MFFHQFYLGCLAHASYMVGSEGVAAVVDPQRDVEQYLEEAARQNLRIAYVIETHLHADFVSGHRELAARTGAKIYAGHAAHASFPHHAVREGDEIRFGQCVLRFLETPGHTVESLCVLVTDLGRSHAHSGAPGVGAGSSEAPFAVLTGDTLFIGDVGRPDLSPDHTPQQLAAMLYQSLHRKLLTLPDSVEVYPAHGAGSLCGRNISAQRQSTIGEQRRMNYALKPMTEADFVRLLTTEFAARPGYFSQDAEINRAGAQVLADLPVPRPLSPDQVSSVAFQLPSDISAAGIASDNSEVETRASELPIILDVRQPEKFGAGHIRGSINIGLGGQFASWAASIIGLDRPIILVAEGTQEIAEARMRLARVGMENVVGYLDGGVEAWHRSGRKLSKIPQITASELHQQVTAVQILDVRREAEWRAGHIADAVHIPLDNLSLVKTNETNVETGVSPVLSSEERIPVALAQLRGDHPVAVHCQGGYRSSIACGLLERFGFHNVMNVIGGFDAWQSAKLPVTTDAEHATA
jgi:hydroxyacylglutathione hydrolase